MNLTIRLFVSAETDLNVPIDIDEYLIVFLRPCKYYPESAFEQVNS